ncbi:ABC transporter permease [Ramlibacter henchirensis]|uniref:ABC transporter permease n=1 Tax=Ramlibacter henchirensis TaxID=204072 RepID=A0A4Z0BWK4_9BURK|nr:ABC transporter permease [Ramlibacter henchirensis]TFZ02628.1 ABC transporter permease [Ramlibacter henchirensis]
MKKESRTALRIARPLVAVLLLAVWIGYIELANIPAFVLPHPKDVAISLYQQLRSGDVLPHLAATAQEAGLGFLLGTSMAVLVGTLISRSRFAEEVLRPYIIASQTTPMVVLAPLFLMWFGFGLMPKVLIAGIITFFPLLVNVMAGLRSVNPTERRLFQSLKASPWQTFIHLEIPSALPFIFAGLRITVVLSVIGSVVGEFVGARAGLGYLAVTAAGNMDTSLLFVAVVLLMAMGLTLYVIVLRLEKHVLFWRT